MRSALALLVATAAFVGCAALREQVAVSCADSCKNVEPKAHAECIGRCHEKSSAK